MAVVVVWLSAPPAVTGAPTVVLRSTGAPLSPATTMKSPIVATSDPRPHNSFWYVLCMVAFKTSYGLIQQALYYSTVYSEPDVDCPSTNLQRANELSPYYVF